MTSTSFSSRLARHPALVMASMLCIVLAAAVALSWEYGVRGLRISVQDSTEASNRTLTRVFVNENWEGVKPLLPPPGSGAEAAKANSHIAAIDQVVRRFSSYTDVLKVKIYDLSGVTVYSSERKQIGEDKSRNTGFLTAARGGVASELTYRGAFGGFDGELFDRNLVSTYVPVRVGDRVEAVLEIYSDRTQSIEFINRELRGLALSMAPWGLAALLLAAVLGWWLHRTQLAMAQEWALAGERSRQQAIRAAASQTVVDGAWDALPAAFDGLEDLLVRAHTAGPASRAAAQPLGMAAEVSLAGSPELQELWARVAMIGRWAQVRAELAGVRDPRDSAAAPAAPDHTPFNLDVLIEEVVSSVAPRAALHSWRISVYSRPSPLGAVRSQRDLVRAVLTHLVGTSIDTPARAGAQGQVQCKFSYTGESLHIDIVDDGAGLSQERLEAWFKDWDQGRPLPPTDAEGLIGWRLLLVRALVQRAGGRFDARSTPGLGNRWSADLPLASA